MLHIKWKYYTKIAIPPYRPFEWKLSEMKQKSICQSNNDNMESALMVSIHGQKE